MGAKEKRFVAGVAALFLSVSLAACGASGKTAADAASEKAAGSEEAAESKFSLKEFKSRDGSVSIQLSDEWESLESEDTLDNWVSAGKADGNEGILVIQIPMVLQSDIEVMIAAMEEGYGAAEIDTGGIADLEIPGLSMETAYICRVKAAGMNRKACFAYGKSDYALYTFIYMNGSLDDSALEYFKACCATFKEEVPEIVSSDTIRWFNAACAVLTAANGQDYNMFGGLLPTDTSAMAAQKSLEEWWSVTDRESAVSNMEWLLTEGHRGEFLEEMGLLTEGGLGNVAADERAAYLYDNYDLTEEEAESYALYYTAYHDNGSTIDAWDYSRAMSLYGWYYISGCYTEEEALDGALALAEQIQTSFESWDDFMESYLLGYEYWAEESSDERRAIYEELKAMPDSIYNLDWNMSFEKSW